MSEKIKIIGDSAVFQDFEDELLSPSDCATKLDVTEAWVYHNISDGTIPCEREQPKGRIGIRLSIIEHIKEIRESYGHQWKKNVDFKNRGGVQ